MRRGTYALIQGLSVNGAGTSEADRVVLEAYEGETVVLDGRNAPRELLVVSGRYVTVRGLTLQNAAAYNLEVRGAMQVVIEGNRFLANRASDSLKGDGGAADVQVRNNEFTQWDSQAIDLHRRVALDDRAEPLPRPARRRCQRHRREVGEPRRHDYRERVHRHAGAVARGRQLAARPPVRGLQRGGRAQHVPRHRRLCGHLLLVFGLSIPGQRPRRRRRRPASGGIRLERAWRLRRRVSAEP